VLEACYSSEDKVPYGKQSAFALGVVFHEIATGEHPFGAGYPLKMPNGNTLDLQHIVEGLHRYNGSLTGDNKLKRRPKWFANIVRGLLHVDSSSRLSVWAALDALRARQMEISSSPCASPCSETSVEELTPALSRTNMLPNQSLQQPQRRRNENNESAQPL